MHSNLINNLKKTVELYILNEASENQIIDEICRIIRLNLKCSESDDSLLQELSFVYASTNTNNNTKSANSEVFTSIKQWISSCIASKCLRHSVQALLGDNDLLEKYYEANCFIRNENFKISLFICLLAFELNQSSLLSQIEVDNDVIGVAGGSRKVKHHKRTSSHPHFSRVGSPPTKTSADELKDSRRCMVTAFRSWKSLPNVQATSPPPFSRNRSKTFSEKIQMVSKWWGFL